MYRSIEEYFLITIGHTNLLYPIHFSSLLVARDSCQFLAMGALHMFPDLPRIDFHEGECRPLAFAEGPDSHWSSFKSMDLAFRPAADDELDLLTQQQHFQMSSKRCPFPESSNYNAFPPWTLELSRAHERIHPSPSQSEGLHSLPYNLAIPRDASPEGWWSGNRPTVEQDSCSGGSTWSPRTSEGRLETDIGSGRLSCSEYPEPMTKFFDFTSSYPEYGGYHSPRPASVIAPCEIQLYPDVAPEDACIKPSLQELEPAHAFHLEVHGYQTQVEIHNQDDEMSSVPEDEDDIVEDVKEEDLSDYIPQSSKRPRRINSRQPASPLSKRPTRTKPLTPTLSKPSKITKRPAAKPLAPTPSPASPLSSKPGKTACPHCSSSFQSFSALTKHTLASHTRPFICSFNRYGCPSTFGSKNEWKRHVSSQHLRLGIYRCDIGACVPVSSQHRRKSSSSSVGNSKCLRAAGGNGIASESVAGFNEFNRKDLFTQHVRRMHGPPTSASRTEKDAFDASLDAVRERCLISLRDSPPRSICGFCNSPAKANTRPDGVAAHGSRDVVFEGHSAWDERMEHVGKHLERGEGAEMEDEGLREWMVGEGLVTRENGKWRVVGCGGRRRGRAGVGVDAGGSKGRDDDKGCCEGEEDGEGEYE